MKNIITLILSLAFALSLLTACGSESQIGTQSEGSKAEEQSESPQAEVQYINTFIASDPSTLDCARYLGIVDRVILHSITEPLTRIQDGIVTAAGAESWDISDDGLIYTFHLRENYWEDGQQVTASDYAYAMQRQADPANAWSFASDFFSIVNYEAVYNGGRMFLLWV